MRFENWAVLEASNVYQELFYLSEIFLVPAFSRVSKMEFIVEPMATIEAFDST